MKREVGLWIDQRKAVIVTIIHPDDGMRSIQANLEKNVYFSTGMEGDGSVQERGERLYVDRLTSYYEQIITCIRDAESIQIFGPGETKRDLQKRLQREKLGGRIVSIESSEKMTDRQIEAKVWSHFLCHSL